MDERNIDVFGHERPTIGRSAWTGYLLALAATFLLLFTAYSGALAVLYQSGHLPPPAIINELCGDEKLEWLRDVPPQDPNLLVVGSSLAWRNIDSEQFVLRNSGSRPLNGGFCHTQIHQAGFVAEYLVRHLPSIRTVVAVVGPQDMLDCTRSPRQLFVPSTTDQYVFARRWAYPFYISHFDPVSLVRNATMIRALRESLRAGNTLRMTRYGDGPMDVTGDLHLGLQYADLKPYDPSCFGSLRSLAETLAADGRSLLVVENPMNPRWSARYDKDGQRLDDLAAGIRSALQGTGAKFWDGDADFAGQPSEFADAIHLKWRAAQRFTGMVASRLEDDQDLF